MKTVYLFVGQMGSGKSWLGSRFAKRIKAHFYEGDDSLPPELKAKVERCAPLTREEVKKFVREHLWWDCLIGANQHGCVVVSQALYNDSDRLWLTSRLRAWGCDVLFVHVKVPIWKNIKQLWGRRNGLRWILMWALSRSWFETPTHPCLEIAEVNHV